MFPRAASLSRAGRVMAGKITSDLLGSVRRGRSLTRSPPSTYRSRVRRATRSSSMAYSRRSSRARASGVRRTSTAAGSHGAQVSKGKKRLTRRGRKKIKVSPKLKAAIKQTVDNNKVRGYFQDNRIDILDPGQLGGQQSVEQFPLRGSSHAGYLFNYDRILHAASRLWNAKAANNNPDVTDANNFDPTNTVIECVKQWWTFRMRNNSSRTATYRIYKCQKKNSSLTNNAITAWSGGLTQMAADGQLLTPANINIMHTGPTLSNQFRTAWKAEEMKIILDPGEWYEFSVSGPCMTYRGQDFYNANVYQPVQKQDIQIIVSSNVDLVGSHTAGVVNNAGYAPDFVAETSQERTYIEGTYHAQLAMPEKVGGVTTAVGTIFQNTNRIRRTVIDEFQPVTFGTAIHRRDEENPVVEAV